MKEKGIGLLYEVGRAAVCITVGALVAEGAAICGNALVKDANMVRNAVATSKQPAKKSFFKKGGK